MVRRTESVHHLRLEPIRQLCTVRARCLSGGALRSGIHRLPVLLRQCATVHREEAHDVRPCLLLPHVHVRVLLLLLSALLSGLLRPVLLHVQLLQLYARHGSVDVDVSVN